jgi:hypothetical protein
MASGVPDGQKDRLVFFPGFFEHFSRPGMPVHGIVRVLLQVGAAGMGETIKISLITL